MARDVTKNDDVDVMYESAMSKEADSFQKQKMA